MKYYPLLRGRQNELLAIRELLEEGGLNNVVPIIEPVRFSSTLISTFNSFISKNKTINYILNPQVGSFFKDIEDKEASEKYKTFHEKILGSSNVIKTVYVSEGCEKILMDNHDIPVSNISAICLDQDYLETYERLFHGEEYTNIIPYDPYFRRIKTDKSIELVDCFKEIKRDRNSEYAEKTDEFFSGYHIYAKEDNYYGFSDYSIVGDEYQDSGFAPYAIVIHIVYFDSNGNLRIKHFVSDSRYDTNNPAGKFGEALKKLHDWNSEHKLNTSAMNEFEEMHQKGSYPGLGVIKKLSIKHHLELMDRYLEDRG